MHDLKKIVSGLNPSDAIKILELSEKGDNELLYYYVDSVITNEENVFTKTLNSKLSPEIYLFRDYLSESAEQDNDALDYLSLDDYCENEEMY
jgi:DNA-directed RNA polymerase specialized sigma54-like protein